jgi:D-galactarolactone isomerase
MRDAPFAIPPGATDTHMHVYAASRSAPASDGAGTSLAEYRAEMEHLGLSRMVVVQPSTYDGESGLTLAAVAALGPEARGVVICRPDVGERELDLLAAQGVTGLRWLPSRENAAEWAEADRLSARLRDRGWHLDLQFDGSQLPEWEAFLLGLRCNLVIDHFARLPTPPDLHSPHFAALARLLDAGRVWIKLSAPYACSRSGSPSFEDVAPIATRLINHAPDRCLWGSNWPQPNLSAPVTMARLLALLCRWAPDPRLRRRILTENPASLYGFSPAPPDH